MFFADFYYADRIGGFSHLISIHYRPWTAGARRRPHPRRRPGEDDDLPPLWDVVVLLAGGGRLQGSETGGQGAGRPFLGRAGALLLAAGALGSLLPAAGGRGGGSLGDTEHVLQ